MAEILCSNELRCSFVIEIYVILLTFPAVYILQVYSIIRHRKAHFASVFYTIFLLKSFWDVVGLTDFVFFLQTIIDSLVLLNDKHDIDVQSMDVSISRSSRHFARFENIFI